MRELRPCSFALTAAVLLFMLTVGKVEADEQTHTYTDKEDLPIYANKMGPFNNPLETYAYFELPGCPPASWEHKFPSLGQALVGDELFKMNTAVNYKQDVKEKQKVCSFTPTQAQADQWTVMVRQQYWYQLYADELPMWATLGKFDKKEGTASIYTVQNFKFGYNGDKLVLANLAATEATVIKAGQTYEFTYTVKFEADTTTFENRYRRYLDNSFFEHRIHWFSLFNSFMMVLFLAGLVITILSRTLRADYARIQKEKQDAGESIDWGDESGWKRVHCDVFRVPPQAALLCACVGTGTHLLVLSFLVTLIAIASVVYTSPGSLLTYFVIAYVLTSFVSGYSSSNQWIQYVKVGPAIGGQWQKALFLTAMLFPGYVMASGFGLNCVAILYDSAQAIPFGGMVVMLLLWLFAAVPLVVVGTMVSRHFDPVGSPNSMVGKSRGGIPHVSQIPSAIPHPKYCFLTRAAFVMLGGLLPFGSIFIELYFVFTSFWNYKLYYVYGFMLLVSIILVLVTACISVVCTYFLLNNEEHRWPWTSWGVGASVGGYVLLYAMYFYWFKTKMTGLFMFIFYFSYMGMLCVGITFVCGAVSFLSANSFVRMIYATMKVD